VKSVEKAYGLAVHMSIGESIFEHSTLPLTISVKILVTIPSFETAKPVARTGFPEHLKTFAVGETLKSPRITRWSVFVPPQLLQLTPLDMAKYTINRHLIRYVDPREKQDECN